jgi:hypothetical protein
MRVRKAIAAALAALVLFCEPCRSYSVLTHEEIVDVLWDREIASTLRQKFPNLTAAELKEAHAYAYGGSVIQDLGYYPFGSHEFSDLVHYVRSGDFVEALLRDAETPDEYAFAIGALAHYASDVDGHPAVNRAVAIEYPKLEREYGSSVTYAQDKTAHIRTEFGFDMLQVAKGRYLNPQYHDFIGFEVAEPLLERAFRETYGLELKDVIKQEDLAVGSFRRAISQWIPELTRAAVSTRHDQLEHEIPDFAREKFIYNVSRADYDKQWGTKYQKPGIGAKILGFLLRLIPKIGPFKAAAVKNPTAATEDMYFKSVDRTIDQLRGMLVQLRFGKLQLANRDFDTGKITHAGEYKLTDEAYSKLLSQLAKANFAEVSAPLQENIMQFYSTETLSPRTAGKDWQKTKKNLDDLRAIDLAHSNEQRNRSAGFR